MEQARLKALHRADLREGLEKDSMTYSPALEDIFDSKLTKYFQQAIEEHYKSKQRVCYKLHHIGKWSGGSSPIELVFFFIVIIMVVMSILTSASCSFYSYIPHFPSSISFLALTIACI